MPEFNRSPFEMQELNYFFLSALEELCNRALAFDQASLHAIGGLSGRCLAIQSELPVVNQALQFMITFSTQGLQFEMLGEDEFQSADASVRAKSFITLARFFRGRFDPAQENDAHLHVNGDLELVDQFQDILIALDIDWEEPLSRVTGDIFAHEAKRFVADVGALVNDGESLKRNIETAGQKAAEFFEQRLDKSLNTISEHFFSRMAGSAKYSRDSENQDRQSPVPVNETKAIDEIEAMQDIAEQKISAIEGRSGISENAIKSGSW